MMWIIDEFEDQLRKDLRYDNINGSISAAIVERDKIIWARALGSVHPGSDQPADSQTIYRAGSITKSLTAFLMMQLVQDGVIDLEQSVESCLPEIRGIEGYSGSTDFTFRQLASHTAGLVREPKLEKADAGPIEEWDSKVLQSIPHTSFEFQPGERFGYSNIGYGILGVALSRAANTPFIELVEERILKPLQMENSFFIVPEHKLENLAQGIGGGPFGDEELNLEGPAAEHRGRGYKVPNGGLYSTPTDLGKFLVALIGYTTLVENQYIELMYTKQTPEPAYHSYGLGMELYQDPAIAIAGHAGSVWGYTSYFGFEKACQYGVVFMRNYNWGTTSWDFSPKILLRKFLEFEKNNSDPF
jgi:CubicO group peptidase (beta-lactamase class C family)